MLCMLACPARPRCHMIQNCRALFPIEPYFWHQDIVLLPPLKTFRPECLRQQTHNTSAAYCHGGSTEASPGPNTASTTGIQIQNTIMASPQLSSRVAILERTWWMAVEEEAEAAGA